MKPVNRFLSCLILFLGLASAQTILEVAAEDPGLSTFVSVVEQAGLSDALNGEGPFTIFAPTNAAFLQVPQAELEALLSNPETLQRVLSYHVVPALVMARDAVSATEAPTLTGDLITVRVESGNLLINESKVVKFDVGATDNMQASNGVIHVIDSLLVPVGVTLAQASTAPRIGAPVSLVASDMLQVYETAAERSVRYEVSDIDGSGVSGSVLIADYGFNDAVVTILVRGTPMHGMHPAHFHSGNCGSGGDIVVPLGDVRGSSGWSISTMTAPYDAITSGDHYLNIHLSPEDMGTIVACGEAGQDAD